jgi:hypothetical protein
MEICHKKEFEPLKMMYSINVYFTVISLLQDKNISSRKIKNPHSIELAALSPFPSEQLRGFFNVS